MRQRWPQAEALLQVEKEILITHDAKPVAKLVRVIEQPKPRKRFDPVAHARWQRKMARGKISLPRYKLPPEAPARGARE